MKKGGGRMGKKTSSTGYIQFTDEETTKVITGKRQSQDSKPSCPIPELFLPCRNVVKMTSALKGPAVL